MSINELFTGGGIALAAILTLVQFSPIKVNPWTALGKLAKLGLKQLGRLLTGDVLDQLTSLETEVTALKGDVAGVQRQMEEMSSSNGEQAAISARARILRFGDEVLHNIKHTKDHFDSVLRDAKMYGRYCASHPDFENGVTEPTIERIKAVYAERLEKNDFL